MVVELGWISGDKWHFISSIKASVTFFLLIINTSSVYLTSEIVNTRITRENITNKIQDMCWRSYYLAGESGTGIGAALLFAEFIVNGLGACGCGTAGCCAAVACWCCANCCACCCCWTRSASRCWNSALSAGASWRRNSYLVNSECFSDVLSISIKSTVLIL